MSRHTCGGWRRVGLPELIDALLDDRKFEFSIKGTLFAMVANRACAPSSKLYCHEQWLTEDVRIEGCESLRLHHLYRAMDFLETHKEALEQGLYFRMADLLNLDVEVVFYDTTSLHFEVDEEDTGVALPTWHLPHGSRGYRNTDQAPYADCWSAPGGVIRVRPIRVQTIRRRARQRRSEGRHCTRGEDCPTRR